jgi:hypothetical protein
MAGSGSVMSTPRDRGRAPPERKSRPRQGAAILESIISAAKNKPSGRRKQSRAIQAGNAFLAPRRLW